MLVYLAGPIRGNDDYALDFAKAEFAAMRSGHSVINPAKLPLNMPQNSYMPICLSMLEQADAIMMLPGWEQSKGANIEKAYAEYQGKEVLYHDGK